MSVLLEDVGARSEATASEPEEASSSATQGEQVRSTGLRALLQQEDLNFLLTNRIPRRWASLAMGWFSRLELPWLTRLSLWIWRCCAGDLDLSESKQKSFRSLHECFVRELEPGARPVDPDPAVHVSPCDAIVGECGPIDGTRVFQAKGFPYTLEDLLPDPDLVRRYRDGRYVTLRLKSTFYHRFHAPHDCRVRGVTYVSGDTWNVNPIALERVERLFCRNERAVLDLDLGDPARALTLVPVAAILVASMRFHCIDRVFDLRHRGPNRFECDQAYAKGDELGWFQHGSTILVFVRGDLELAPGVRRGARIRMGEPLFVAGGTRPHPDPPSRTRS